MSLSDHIDQLDAELQGLDGRAADRLEGEIECLRLLDQMLDHRPGRVIEALKVALVLLRAPSPGQLLRAARSWEQERSRAAAGAPLWAEVELGLAVRDLQEKQP